MKISFVSQYYRGFLLPENFYLQSTETELTKCVSTLFLKRIVQENVPEREPEWPDVIVCEMNYSNGFVNIKAGNKDFLLDAINLNFYFNKLLPSLQEIKKDDSENLLQLKLQLESVVCYQEAAKISEIYLDSLKKYIHYYKCSEEPGVNLVKKFSEHLLCSQGVKGFRYLKPPFLFFPSPTIADPIILPNHRQCKFTKCIKKLPPSFLSCKSKEDRKLIKLFMRKAINIKEGKEDKVLLLKQIIFFALFKQFLCSFFTKKIDLARSPIQKQFLTYASNKCSFSDLLIMIPLTYRSPLLTDHSKKFSLFTSKEIANKEISKAHLAYKNLLELFFELYKFTPEKLGHNNLTPSLDQKKIHLFIKGISSLAISGGGIGRYAFYEYCLQSGEDLSENISLEIILAETENFFTQNLSCKESHLGYFFKIFGSLPTAELHEIDIATNIIKKVLENAPIEQCLKKNEEGKYILHKKALQNLVQFYVQGEKDLKESFGFFDAKNSN